MVFENEFKDKSVLVTGAGRGIGRAIAVKLASIGATVWAVSKNPDNLAKLKVECPTIEIVAVDLGDWAATREAIQKIPVVDCLVNNAATFVAGIFMTVKPDDFDMLSDVNLKGVINVSQVVAGKMIEAKKPGSIVNVSSLASLLPSPGITIYSTLKSGLDQLTKIMAIELGPHKIRVNSISPACVQTDMMDAFVGSAVSSGDFNLDDLIKRIPLRRPVVEMEEVVNTVLFYLSDLAPIITGTLMPIDGGVIIT